MDIRAEERRIVRNSLLAMLLSLEQAVLAVGAYLALATLLSGPELAVIPVAVLLFGLGRVAFLIGYPRGAAARSFGMATTVAPTLFGFLLALALIVLRS